MTWNLLLILYFVQNAGRHRCLILPLTGCGHIVCVEVACLVFVGFGKLKYFPPNDPVNKPSFLVLCSHLPCTTSVSIALCPSHVSLVFFHCSYICLGLSSCQNMLWLQSWAWKHVLYAFFFFYLNRHFFLFLIANFYKYLFKQQIFIVAFVRSRHLSYFLGSFVSGRTFFKSVMLLFSTAHNINS